MNKNYGYFGSGLSGYVHYITAVSRTSALTDVGAKRVQKTVTHQPKSAQKQAGLCSGLLIGLAVLGLIIFFELWVGSF